MVDEMNEVVEMKHDQWSVDWGKWDETLTMKLIIKHFAVFISSTVIKSIRVTSLDLRDTLLLFW